MLIAVKGTHPLSPLEERMAILEALVIVAQVVVDTSSDKLKVWERVRLDVLFEGDDWKGRRRASGLNATSPRWMRGSATSPTPEPPVPPSPEKRWDRISAS